jgi:Mn-dependent DtxR family transcriptional regulator
LPLSEQERKLILKSEIKELAVQQWTQSAIASKIGVSQQTVSRYLQQIEEESKVGLQTYYEKVPYAYEEALTSTRLLKRFLWSKLNNTSDARSIQGLATILHTVTIDYLRMLAMGQDVKDTVDNATMLAREARQELKELKEKYGTPTATVGSMLEAKESIGAKGDSSDSDVVSLSSSSSFSLADGSSSDSSSVNDDKSTEVIDSQREGRVSYIPLDVPYSTSSSSSSSESCEPDALQDSFRPLRGALNPKDGKESDEDSITSSSNGASSI